MFTFLCVFSQAGRQTCCVRQGGRRNGCHRQNGGCGFSERQNIQEGGNCKFWSMLSSFLTITSLRQSIMAEHCNTWNKKCDTLSMIVCVCWVCICMFCTRMKVCLWVHVPFFCCSKNQEVNINCVSDNTTDVLLYCSFFDVILFGKWQFVKTIKTAKVSVMLFFLHHVCLIVTFL